MSKLQQFNAAARKKIAALHTEDLDDFKIPRKQMATASEIGGCQRKAVLNALYPPVYDNQKLMVFERGHIFELIMENYLQAMDFKKVAPDKLASTPGPCYVGGTGKQYGIMHSDLPVGCHIDFVIKHKNGSLFVIECKTTDGIPDEPYSSWVDQLHVQLGLLADQFPGVEIRGGILVRDLNRGEEKEFNSYEPNNTVYSYLLERGAKLAEAKRTKTPLEPSEGPLCEFCDHRRSCPAHVGGQELPKELVPAVKELAHLTEMQKLLNEFLEKEKNKIRSFVGDQSYRGSNAELDLVVSKFNESETVDAKKLKENFPAVYDQVKKTKAGFLKIQAKKRVPTAPAAEIQDAA